MARKLLVFSSHPIQYFSPLYKRISSFDDINLLVCYYNQPENSSYFDSGFGREINWDVDLCTGFRSRYLNLSCISLFKKIIVLFSLFKAEKPKCILVSSYVSKNDLLCLIFAKIFGAKTIIRGEFIEFRKSSIRDWLKYFWLKIFFRFIDRACSIGFNSRAFLLNYVKNQLIFDSPYSVSLPSIDGSKSPDFERFRVNGSDRDSIVRVVFVGKLIPRKGVLEFVECCIAANDRLLGSGYRIIPCIVGSGELESDLKEVLRLTDHYWFGFVNQSLLPWVYRFGDIFVLPSLYETWGLVANEAMSMSLASIVSERAGCCEDLIVNGVTGLQYSPSRKDDLVEKLVCLTTEPCFREMLGEYGCKWVSEFFSIELSAAGVRKACWCDD